MAPEQTKKTEISSEDPNETARRKSEQTVYMGKLQAMQLQQQNAITSNAAKVVVKSLDIPYDQIRKSLSAPQKNPEQQSIVDLYTQEIIQTIKYIEASQRNLDSIKEWRKTNRNAEDLLADALTSVSKKINMPVDTLRSICEAKNFFEEQKDLPTGLLLAEKAEALKTVVDTYLKTERSVIENQKYLTVLKGWRGIEVHNGSAEDLFTEALADVSKKARIAPEVLRAVCDAKSLYEQQKDLPTDLSLAEKAKAIKTVHDTFVELENRFRSEQALETEVLDIDALIAKTNVSAEQKAQWKQMLTLDIPKDARIKVISLIGGAGLSMKGELDHVKSGLKKAKGTSTVIYASTIDNTKLTKEETLVAMKREEEADDADFIIVYASSHGLTPSIDTPELPMRLGFTELGSKDDIFHIQNEKATDTADSKMYKYYSEATEAVQALLKENPNFFKDRKGQPRVIKPGEIVTIGKHNIRIIEDTKEPDELIKRLLLYLYVQDIAQHSVSSDDLLKLQQEAVSKNPKKEVLYILDNCFSGSATDDRLASLPSTKAILAASSADEPARESSKTHRGEFMEELFHNLELGNSLGEAFIRADIKLNFSAHPRFSPSSGAKHWQNPSGAVKNVKGETIRVSSVSDSIFPIRDNSDEKDRVAQS